MTWRQGGTRSVAPFVIALGMGAVLAACSSPMQASDLVGTWSSPGAGAMQLELASDGSLTLNSAPKNLLNLTAQTVDSLTWDHVVDVSGTWISTPDDSVRLTLDSSQGFPGSWMYVYPTGRADAAQLCFILDVDSTSGDLCLSREDR